MLLSLLRALLCGLSSVSAVFVRGMPRRGWSSNTARDLLYYCGVVDKLRLLHSCAFGTLLYLCNGSHARNLYTFPRFKTTP